MEFESDVTAYVKSILKLFNHCDFFYFILTVNLSKPKLVNYKIDTL